VCVHPSLFRRTKLVLSVVKHSCSFWGFFAPSTTIAWPPHGAYSVCSGVKSGFWGHGGQRRLVPVACHGNQLHSRDIPQGTAAPPPHSVLPGADPPIYFGLLMKIFSTQSPPGHAGLAGDLAQCSVCQQDAEIWKRRSPVSSTGLQSCQSSTRNKSEKAFATEVGYYVTGRADSGMQPPLLGNRADSLSAFQQELLLSLPGFARYGGNRLESKGKFFSQTVPASGG